KELHDRAGTDRQLTFNEYRTLGGVQGAIAAKLVSVLSDPQPTEDEVRALQRAFTRYLIRVDEGAVEGERLLRRVVPRTALPRSADRVLRRLVDAGLLMTKEAWRQLRCARPSCSATGPKPAKCCARPRTSCGRNGRSCA